jgi:dolichyl-diphosphooligosaccharide--protein glycosyltransferase
MVGFFPVKPTEPKSAPADRAPGRARASRPLIATALVAIVGLTVFFRYVAAHAFVFPAPGEVRLFDTDSYYHLRHIRFAARHFPRIQRFDPASYPRGVRAPHAGLFDLSIAAGALAAGGGHPSDLAIERAAAWAPPVFGALVALALFWLGATLAGPRAGAIASALLLLYPGTFLNRSLLGFTDHHVAEVLLLLLAAAGLARCLRGAASEPPAPWWRPAALQALPLSAALFTWYGAPIYVLLIGTVFLLFATIALARKDDPAPLARAAARYGLGALVTIVPAALVAPWLVMDPGLLEKSCLALGALAAGLPLYVAIGSRIARRGVPGPAVAAGGLALMGLALFLAVRAFPQARFLFDELLGVKSALVREQAAVTLAGYWYLSGPPGVLALVATALVLFDAARGRDRSFALAPVALGALLTALWWRTHDYGYAPPAFAALATALLVERALALVRGRALWATGAAAGALFLAPIWPFDAVYPPWSAPPIVSRLMILNEGWVQALRWTAANTPEPALPIDAPVRDEAGLEHPAGSYGILSFWDFGHYIASIGRRAPVASGGISTHAAEWFFLTDEESSLRELDRGCKDGQHVRYVMVDGRTAADYVQAALQMAGKSSADYRQEIGKVDAGGQRLTLVTYGERFERSMIARLYDEDGRELGHYRLVYSSPHKSYITYAATPVRVPGGTALRVVRRAFPIDSPEEGRRYAEWIRKGSVIGSPAGLLYGGFITSSVKVFEAVPGARIAGRARPGARVQARLGLRSLADGRTISYVRTAAAGPDGRFEIVVPYSIGPSARSTSVFAPVPYEVFVLGEGGGADVRIGLARVSEEAVRSGARVEVIEK